jgi:hypothetical protein
MRNGGSRTQHRQHTTTLDLLKLTVSAHDGSLVRWKWMHRARSTPRGSAASASEV